MSWNVNGRTYHDAAAYLQAQAATEASIARQAAERAHAEYQRLQQLQRQSEANLAAVRNDAAALRRALAQHEQLTAQVSREQARLHEQQQQHAVRMDQIRAEAARLDAQFQQQLAATRRTVDEGLRAVQAELSAGLADAQRRRSETEQRLTQAMREADARLVDERRRRIEQESSADRRASAAIAIAEEQLASIAPGDVSRLGVGAERRAVESHLAQARTLASQGDAVAAQAAAASAAAAVATLLQAAGERQAALDAARQSAVLRTQALLTSLQDETLGQVFPDEVARLTALASGLQQSAASTYDSHGALEVRRVRDEQQLDSLERLRNAIVDSRDAVLEQLKARSSRFEPLLAGLEREYGSHSKIEQRLRNPKDPKSDLVVDLSFGSQHVLVSIDLSGNVQLDGYGHASNTECGARATGAVRALQSVLAVQNGGPQVSQGNRQQPLPSHQAAPEAAPWRDVAQSLSRLEARV